MIIKILFLVFFFQTQDLRENYAKASETEAKSSAFLRKVEKVSKKSNATLQAYKGAALIISAKYESGIFQKTKLVKDGTSWIEEAIKQDKNDLEIRMIRHSIQSNLPKILGYYKNISEDRKLMLAGVDKIENSSLRNFLVLYLENTK